MVCSIHRNSGKFQNTTKKSVSCFYRYAYSCEQEWAQEIMELSRTMTDILSFSSPSSSNMNWEQLGVAKSDKNHAR